MPITGSAVPYFIVKGAEAAIAFYREALGAEEVFRMTDPGDGRIGHAEMRLGSGTFMLADEYPDFGALSPDTVGGTPVTFYLESDTVDDDATRAVAAGATLVRAPKDESFGHRVSLLLDPFGHRWMLSQKIEDVTPQDMQRRWEEETGA